MAQKGSFLKCELCTATVQSTSPEARKWDWFTGTLRRTHHYCPNHKDSEEAKKMFAKSRKAWGNE